MRTRLRALVLILLAASWACAQAVAGGEEGAVRMLASPDGRIAVRVELPASGSQDTPRWSATFRGKPILSLCRLSLALAGEGDVLAGARLRREETRSADRRVRVRFGKTDWASDRYEERRYSLESPRGRRVDVVFRCYDDAIALRYVLPKQAGTGPATITEEDTSYTLAGAPTAYLQYLENYRTSHEHQVTTVSYPDAPPDTLLDLPATFTWADGTCLALTEAALRKYAGMALMRRTGGAGALELVCRLTPRPDGSKVVRPLPLETPWRVAMVGDRPGTLLESNVLYCLNEPSVIGDASWIRPGKITFSWWNGDVYDGKRGLPILSLEMARRYIDFCARSGIPYHAVIADETVTPWYHQTKQGVEPGPDTDVTRPRSDLDLAGIRRYSESRGIRLWTWVHQGALRGRVEEAFAAFERLGWRGMMVDFFDHDDQESVEFAEEILRAAARHRILIHFHGVWKPTGWQRTFPNLMNHEGALNLEYLKWSDLCTPDHTLKLAFTRLIAGPMDYHLGGFRQTSIHPPGIAANDLRGVGDLTETDTLRGGGARLGAKPGPEAVADPVGIIQSKAIAAFA